MRVRSVLRRPRLMTAAAGVLLGSVCLAAIVNTTSNDFVMPGSQVEGVSDPMLTSTSCRSCHGSFAPPNDVLAAEPYALWKGSMMAQAARDPVFYATLAIANQDAAFSGELCIRCHSPMAYLGGRAAADGSQMLADDRDGVNCNFCHRLVDPYYKPGISPIDDLADLAVVDIPPKPGNGMYVMDLEDVRRGPFGFTPPETEPPHTWLQSPFHRESDLCATCHDVSNPALSRVPGTDTYVFNNTDEPHPTQDKADEFPVERTYSEWASSDFVNGVDMQGRFGGNQQVVSTCQDCHMQRVSGAACRYFFNPVVRTDVPQHDLTGGNTWVPQMIKNLYPAEVVASQLDAGILRARSMLQRAADMELSQTGSLLRIRIINQTGHKLPTGYPEGRRMWLNVRFYDGAGGLLDERGHYDAVTADLTQDDTKVYEIKQGLDAAAAAATGIPEGESFHFVLNNKIYKDNRIPPRGFTNAGFAAVQAAPVGHSYADGQYWDDTFIAIPFDAVSAEVRLYYQTSSKEYILFLRDTNTTTNDGQVLYDQWLATGMSPPEQMVSQSAALDPIALYDADGDGDIDIVDFAVMQGCFNAGSPLPEPCFIFDADASGMIDLTDFAGFDGAYGGPG